MVGRSQEAGEKAIVLSLPVAGDLAGFD